ncbi:unnamed protein product [Porites lobata]|uniref:Barrier-to-autointegration factor n=1 Tax=Porites lobata TaxID=104759 RepID=A0ABN8PBX4_9CNID|nr:unnamed protein product [Porites lobata]
MSSTSQKHRNFVSEPMGEKDVTELAGIGEVLGGKLKEKGFDKAYVVLGQFLVLKKDQEMFMDWIKDECGANKKQGGDCYNCLKEWSFVSDLQGSLASTTLANEPDKYGETIAVVFELTKRTQEMLFADWAQ